MPNPRTLAAALLVAISIPITAFADDDVVAEPPAEPAPVEVQPIAPPVVAPVVVGPVAPPNAASTTTTTTSTGTTTTTTTTITPVVAPVVVVPAPVAPAPVAPVAAPIIQPPAIAPIATPTEYACEMRGRAKWRSRLKGKLSLGFSKGHVELEDETEGSQKSLIGRINGRRGWSVELEFARLALDGGDKARTASGAVLKAFGKRRLAPYVIAGAGGGRLDRADGTEQHVRFAEIGGGLMVRGKRLTIGVDFRRGARHVEGDESEPGMDTVVGRGATSPTDDDHHGERYVRGRILALVNF